MTETTKPTQVTRHTETVWRYQGTEILVFRGDGKYYVPIVTTNAATLEALAEAISEALPPVTLPTA